MSADMRAAGWFTDPSDPTLQRYWNGSEWTEHQAPVSPGHAPQPGRVAGIPPNADGAVTSLVLGIVSLLFCGLLSGIPAVITARRATRAIDQSQGQLGGRGLATAGFVTGLIGTIWSGLALGFVVVVFIFGSAVSSSFEETCSTIVTSPSASSTDC